MDREPCPRTGDQIVGRPHPEIPGVTWYDVPYDFGLSAGKTFLTAQTTTEFVLILDDDFVRTPHTSAARPLRSLP